MLRRSFLKGLLALPVAVTAAKALPKSGSSHEYSIEFDDWNDTLPTGIRVFKYVGDGAKVRKIELERNYDFMIVKKENDHAVL